MHFSLIQFSIINHPFGGSRIYGKPVKMFFSPNGQVDYRKGYMIISKNSMWVCPKNEVD